MLESMKKLQKGTLEEVNVNMTFPLMRWLTGKPANYPICSYVNRNFFYVDKEILLGALSLGITTKGFMPYPKPKKFDKKAFDLVVIVLKKRYFLSNSDIQQAKKIIEDLLKDKTKLEEIATSEGLDNKERKVLGLDKIVFKKMKMSKSKVKKFF